jgi:hypothetical protein
MKVLIITILLSLACGDYGTLTDGQRYATCNGYLVVRDKAGEDVSLIFDCVGTEGLYTFEGLRKVSYGDISPK